MRRKKKWTKQQLAQRHLDGAIRGLVGYIRFDYLKRQTMNTAEAMEVIARFLDDADQLKFDWDSVLEEIREEEKDAKARR